MLEQDMLAKKVWAVVGANQDPDKFGNRIYHKLKRFNYKVYAVNPRYPEIDGDPCYPDLASLPEKPEVIDMVVSPAIGKATLEEAARLGIRYIWLQPGTWDDAIMAQIASLGLEAVQGCVLIFVR